VEEIRKLLVAEGQKWKNIEREHRKKMRKVIHQGHGKGAKHHSLDITGQEKEELGLILADAEIERHRVRVNQPVFANIGSGEKSETHCTVYLHPTANGGLVSLYGNNSENGTPSPVLQCLLCMLFNPKDPNSDSYRWALQL